jgi:MYXO-CTERM domain-containing protein
MDWAEDGAMFLTTIAAVTAYANPSELALSELLDAPDRGIPGDVSFDDLLEDEPDLRVVGGRQVKSGRWDDAVGVVFYGAYVGCTGTLIGPRVVLTAGHCVSGGPVTHVVVGSKNWAMGDGAVYEVEDAVEFPNSQVTRDIALLFLAEPVKDVEPRPIGMECITERYLERGAPVQIVGYGATTESGDGFNTALNEARSEVLDPSCKENFINGIYAGCSAAAKPAGEVAAGGNGVDACFGDSGGPLYLLTDEGDYVIGATSRAFLGVSAAYPCRDGGIWVRPDAVIDWILDEAGPKRDIAMPTCNEAPLAEAEPLEVRGGRSGEVEVVIDDPDGDPEAAVLTITTPPAHGTATVDGLVVTYVAAEGYRGPDTIGVTVTDEGTEWEYTGAPVASELTIDVTVEQALLGCACDGSSGSLGGLLGAAGLAGLVARRRR